MIRSIKTIMRQDREPYRVPRQGAGCDPHSMRLAGRHI